MPQIDKLEIRNFKFFDDVEPLEFGTKNVLIYGENGSGKSTIYWALYTILQSSLKEDDKIKNYFTKEDDDSLVNIYADEDDSKVSLYIKDDDSDYTISKNSITIKETNLLEKALYTSDFINYKYLFRFFNFLHRDEIDLFSLFEYEILQYLNKDGQNLNDLWKEILELVKIKPNQHHSQKRQHDSLTSYLLTLHSHLEFFLTDIALKAKEYLSQFGYNDITIAFESRTGKYERITDRPPYFFTKPKITLFVKSGDIPVSKPQSYFNEAKLTAIALSVRFAITKMKLKESSLKLLVLDDLLISLDMSNRDKVIEILSNDDDLKTYQKIILTHDRAFFEMAKHKFSYYDDKEWKYFEMYVDKNDHIEFPFIKKYGQKYANIERAKEHFENKDYPACANYLRKEVEKLFNNYLELDNLDAKINLAKLKENSHIIIELSKELKNILRVLQQFEHCERMPENIQAQKCKEFSDQVVSSIRTMTSYIDNKIHFEEFEDVKLVLKSILHPQSHSDITKPLYKKELEDAIKLMEAFESLIN